jgi:hypothetical protein
VHLQQERMRVVFALKKLEGFSKLLISDQAKHLDAQQRRRLLVTLGKHLFSRFEGVTAHECNYAVDLHNGFLLLRQVPVVLQLLLNALCEFLPVQVPDKFFELLLVDLEISSQRVHVQLHQVVVRHGFRQRERLFLDVFDLDKAGADKVEHVKLLSLKASLILVESILSLLLEQLSREVDRLKRLQEFSLLKLRLTQVEMVFVQLYITDRSFPRDSLHLLEQGRVIG